MTDPGTPGAARPLAFLSRTDWVTTRLRNAILTGEVAPGEPLRANELAERWGVSATPLREAFQRLAANGFLVHSAQRGVRVAPISLAEMDELYELRVMLEPLAIARSVTAGDAAWRRGLEESWAALRAALRTEPRDFVSYEVVHRRFHLSLIAAAGSGWLLRVLTQLRDHSERYWALSYKARGGALVAVREHEELFEAGLGGDAERAANVLRRHISRTQETVRTWVAESAGDAGGA